MRYRPNNLWLSAFARSPRHARQSLAVYVGWNNCTEGSRKCADRSGTACNAVSSIALPIIYRANLGSPKDSLSLSTDLLLSIFFIIRKVGEFAPT